MDSDDDLDAEGSAPEPSEPTEPPEEPAPPRTEGVRIIGAEEAAEAVARGDAGTRREPGEPGYGDRPATLDEDERPVLRFPSPITSRDPSSFGAVPIVTAGSPPSEGDAPDAGPASGAEEGTDGGEPTGEHITAPQGDIEFEMPHYSDPPTGQVPRVVIADADDPSESWAGLSGQPRWRGEGQPFEDDDFSDLVDSGPRLGALDQSAEEFFGDDFDAPTGGYGEPDDVMPANRRAAARTAVRRDPRPPRQGGGGDQPSSAGRNMPAAIGVGLALVAIAVICFKIGAIAATLLVAVVLTLCAVELFSTLRSAGYNPATLLGLVAVPALAIAPLADPAFAYPVVVGLTVMAGLIWYLYVNPGPGAVGNLGVTLLGVAWIGGLGSFATLILGVGKVAEDARHLDSNPGIGVLWGVVLVTVCYDVGAFFIGRFLGHSPLSVASPNKTVEGLLGGIAAAIFVPLVILKFWPGGGIMPLGRNLQETFPFCLFCALAAPIGDLCQSAIKRDLDVKDMGDLLPGHGGVLDRFDGFLFVLPVAWFMVHLLGVSPF
jgi:phosphatidate cytidylyltransferase